MFLSIITKNSNWETLTRIYSLLKDGMGLKMENFNIMCVHWKIHFLGGEWWLQKNSMLRGIA